MTETTRFLVTTLGGLICIVVAVLAYLTPPVLALGDPLRLLLLVAGLGAFGVQVATGYGAAQVNDAAMKAGKS